MAARGRLETLTKEEKGLDGGNPITEGSSIAARTSPAYNVAKAPRSAAVGILGRAEPAAPDQTVPSARSRQRNHRKSRVPGVFVLDFLHHLSPQPGHEVCHHLLVRLAERGWLRWRCDAGLPLDVLHH